MGEVLITVVLMGIVTAIASFTYFGVVEDRAVDSAANQLAADMRLAHTNATNQLADWRVNYKANGATFSCGAVTNADYCLVKLGPGGVVLERIPRTLPEGTKILSTNLANLTGLLTGNDRSLEFNSNGSAEVVGGVFSGPESSPTVRVGPEDGSTTNMNRISVATTTSRVSNAG